MAFTKGMPKPPGSGRRKGQITKLTRMVRERIETLGYDPIEALVSIARDKNSSLELRAKVASELMGYTYPRLRQTEHVGAGGGAIEVEVEGSAREILMARIDEIAKRVHGEPAHSDRRPIQ